jgi:hypothetical protein
MMLVHEATRCAPELDHYGKSNSPKSQIFRTGDGQVPCSIMLSSCRQQKSWFVDPALNDMYQLMRCARLHARTHLHITVGNAQTMAVVQRDDELLEQPPHVVLRQAIDLWRGNRKGSAGSHAAELLVLDFYAQLPPAEACAPQLTPCCDWSSMYCERSPPSAYSIAMPRWCDVRNTSCQGMGQQSAVSMTSSLSSCSALQTAYARSHAWCTGDTLSWMMLGCP